MTIPLYELFNCLKKVADNIWIAEGDIIHMDIKVIKIPFSTQNYF